MVLQAEVLWLMAAKEQWLAGHVDVARDILSAAFAANPDSEGIWLAAFKLEFENREPERARALLSKAREHPAASTPRVWMKSAVVERELGDPVAERQLLLDGLARFPDFDKLHLMLGQLVTPLLAQQHPDLKAHHWSLPLKLQRVLSGSSPVQGSSQMLPHFVLILR